MIGPGSSPVLRIGNCSGFYGDRLSAMREMLDGSGSGSGATAGLDVLTGDYLAELTMLILGRDAMRDPSLGYARTFVRQAEECLGLALERRVALVANAGGLNPAGLAERLREVATGLGLHPVIAHVTGDDLRERVDELGLHDTAAGAGGRPGLGRPLTANAYLGAQGIAAALRAGADVVVTGRVTDASLVVGPALARHGWDATAYDALAGATVAGHVLECGTQATGGNFSGFHALGLDRDPRPLGFPVAEIAADGSSVITKQAGTGGAVTVDTVTAQLMYEVQGTAYLGPDVTTHLDSIALTTDGPDRVRIARVRGSAPPDRLKVCLNFLGGFRNGAELVLTGLDVEAKEAWVRSQVEAAFDAGRRPAEVEWSLARTDWANADTEEAASCRLRLTVRDPDPEVVGKAFTAPLVELALGSYPGFTLTGPPAPATPYGVYRAGYVERTAVTERVTVDGRWLDAAGEGVTDEASRSTPAPAGLWSGHGGRATEERAGVPAGAGGRSADAAGSRRVPLGSIVHARSGDKGGDANVGLWVKDAATRPDRVVWLIALVTPELVAALLPEAAGLSVEVHELANLGGVNVVVHGLLGDGVAASSRFDPQAKGLAEWLRSRHLDIPVDLLRDGPERPGGGSR